jgi:hypothetical protein
VSWQGLNFDFTSVVFDGGDFHGAEFSGGMVAFSGVKFSGGTVYFDGAKFFGGMVYFDRAKFSGGMVRFTSAELSSGTVGFTSAEFSGGMVDFSSVGDWSFPPEFSWTGTPPPGVILPTEEDQTASAHGDRE